VQSITAATNSSSQLPLAEVCGNESGSAHAAKKACEVWWYFSSSPESAVDCLFCKNAASKRRQRRKFPPSQLRHRDRPTRMIGPSIRSIRRIRWFKRSNNSAKRTTSRTQSGVDKVDRLPPQSIIARNFGFHHRRTRIPVIGHRFR